MPLDEPPRQAGSLAGLPRHALRGGALFRVWRHELPDGTQRPEPWWFAGAAADAAAAGRFDLIPPMGTCYFGTRPEAALLEALQSRLTNLPEAELRVRRLARIQTPDQAPDAAMLTAARVAGEFGISAELWAGRDRALTRRWAQAARRDGWWALYSGVAHDPSGKLRSVALFDHQGAHAPSHSGSWDWSDQSLHDDTRLKAALKRHGVTVRKPGQLQWATPPS